MRLLTSRLAILFFIAVSLSACGNKPLNLELPEPSTTTETTPDE